MSSKLWHRVIGCACAALIAGGIAACGSSSSKSSSTSSGGGGSSTSASTGTGTSGGGSSTSGGGSSSGAAATVTAALKRPTSINITTPLKSKPPTGKKIIFLRCSQPVCAGFEQGLAPAAKALGWTLTNVGFQPTPEAEVQAIDNAVSQHPAGIFMTGLARSAIESGLKQAQAAHIPVVDGYTTNAAAAPIIANVANGPSGNSSGPKDIANYIANINNCSGNTAVFNIPTYPILNFGTTVMTGTLKKLCPKMTITVHNAQATDVGTSLPSQIVSVLQRDPSIKYVAYSFGDMALGVPQAMKAAGVSADLLGFGAGEPTNVENVAKGEETAESGYGIPYGGYRAMDAFARYFEGMSTKIDTTAINPGQLFDKTNASGVNSWTDVAVAPNMPQQFYKLWHVSGS
jgi:ribose transport system substrate-binding protein